MLPSPAKRAWTMNPRPEWVVTVRMTGTSTETDLSATMPALIAGDVDPLTLTPAVYAESRRVSA